MAAHAKGYLPFKNIHVILCRPEKSGNVGSTARVMYNFGLSNLRIVTERKVPHVSTIEATKFATTHASHILNDAKIFPDLKEVRHSLVIGENDVNYFTLNLTLASSFLPSFVVQPLISIFQRDSDFHVFQ